MTDPAVPTTWQALSGPERRLRMRAFVQQCRASGYHVDQLDRKLNEDPQAAEALFLDLRGSIESLRRIALEARLRGSVEEREVRSLVANASSIEDLREVEKLLINRIETRTTGILDGAGMPAIRGTSGSQLALLLDIIGRVVSANRYFVTFDTVRSVHRVVRKSYPIFNFFVVARDFTVRSEMPDTEDSRDGASMFLHLLLAQIVQLVGEGRAKLLIERSLREAYETEGTPSLIITVAGHLPDIVRDALVGLHAPAAPAAPAPGGPGSTDR